MPSLTRSGAPRSSLVRSSASEMTSTAFAVRSRSWRSTSTAADGNKRTALCRSRAAGCGRYPNFAVRPPSTVMIAPLTNERGGQREVEHHVRDLLGVAVAAQRNAAAGEPLLGVVGDRRGHARADRARADAVDGDALRAELARERTGEADDAVLAHGVRGDERRRAEAFGRRDVHDAARAARARGAAGTRGSCGPAR